MALLYWDKKQSRLTSLEDFSINSIIQSHTVSFVLFVTQRSFPGHPSSKLLLQAADAIRGALVKEERLVKEEQTHGHDAVPVAEAVEVEPSEHQKLYPDEQPDYPFAVEVDSADTTSAHSPSYKNTNGDVSLSQMMEESPQSKSRVLDAPTAEKGPEEEIPKIPKQHDSLESLQQVDEVQAAAPSPPPESLATFWSTNLLHPAMQGHPFLEDMSRRIPLATHGDGVPIWGRFGQKQHGCILGAVCCQILQLKTNNSSSAWSGIHCKASYDGKVS